MSGAREGRGPDGRSGSGGSAGSGGSGGSGGSDAPETLGGPVPVERTGIPPDTFRDGLAHWASGVTVVAVREDDGAIHATTVTSFASLSAEPPRILVSLGPSAQVLPFLDLGGRFVVNLLAREQRRLATVFADPFPVGPSPFPARGDPVMEGVLVALVCRVETLLPVDGVRLVVGRVLSVLPGTAAEPLLRFRRGYRGLAPDS
jgi:flavin reductase (DIM6/NTAB) family NADH-FMN oxidoreductase RutF